MSGNLATILTNSAAEHGDRLALKLDDAEFTYALLDEASARVATMLKAKGLQPGDRVGIMLPNVPYFPVAYYGVLRAGGVVVPMNVLLKGREVGYYLKDPGAKIVFAWHDFVEAAQTGADEAGAEIIEVKPGEIEPLIFAHEPDPDVAAVADEDTAVILYTSGTTGQPKGAELTHANLMKNAATAAGLFSLDETVVVLGALPLFHSFGQTCGMNATIAGGRLPDADPALRAGQGAGDHPARRGHASSRACRRCTARCCICPTAMTTTSRRCACVPPAARRCPSSCCAASRTPSAARCSRATA